VMRYGRRSRHRLVQVAARCNDLPHNRYGFSVGRRVGKAVTRNLVKRRLREIMRELPLRSGYDIVAVAQEPASTATYHELKEAAAHCLRRAGLLETEGPDRGPNRGPSGDRVRDGRPD
jgi:ribonuclease P protein component